MKFAFGRQFRRQRRSGNGKRRPSVRLMLESLEDRAVPAVIVVTGTGDDIAADGLVTLREAITAANTNAASGDAAAGDAGLDIIRFAIGTGPQTIAPASALPTITETLEIQGTSQPGFAGTPLIELDGANAGVNSNGLTLSNHSGSTVRGLIINRFSQNGIAITGGGGHTIAGNYLGTDATGTQDLGNGSAGIAISNADFCQIGGTTAADRNVIAGNGFEGILLQFHADKNRIQGNFIGTDVTGTAGINNGNVNVFILDGASDNLIGGTLPGEGNLISGTTTGIIIGNSDTIGNIVQGNFIGTDVTGLLDLANNEGVGIGITSAVNTIIGGKDPGAGNVIAGHGFAGITIADFGTDGTVIQGNLIGVSSNGKVPIPNARGIYVGIGFSGAPTNTTIGGDMPADGNIIANSTFAGVVVVGGFSGGPMMNTYPVGTLIRGNQIFGNGGLGIDLGDNGVTVNDPDDSDGNENNLQNYPEITSVVGGSGQTTIKGTFHGVPGGVAYFLDFYANDVGDPTSFGEASTYLGSEEVTTDNNGDVTFSIVLPVAVPNGKIITATATDKGNNTSEFSKNEAVVAPAIIVTPTAGLITSEGQTQVTFTVVLATVPTDGVKFSINSSDLSEGIVDQDTLTFTPADALTPQIVTITGENDFSVDGSVGYTIIIGAAESSDLDYAGLDAADVSVTNQDNDSAGVSLQTAAGLQTTEAGGQATFMVVLTSVPTGDVTIPLTSTDLTEGTVSPAQLVFTPANALTPQTVTITGVNDQNVDGNVNYSIQTGAATSTDANYNGLNAADVGVMNQDNDTAAVTVQAAAGLQTTEAGGQATFTVVLTSVPTGDVTIPLTSNDATEGTVSPAILVFTPANALTPQTVTITGVNDASVDGNVGYTIQTGAAVSNDATYNGSNAADVSVSNVDNDAPGITVMPAAGLMTTEVGGQATFTVMLNTLPTADVTILISNSDLTEGTVAPAVLTFTNANALTPQTVTITGVNDAIADGNVGYTIITAAASSNDANYNGLNPVDVGVSNMDDESAGFTVLPIAGLVTTETGGQATFTIVLNTVPTGNVTIALSSSDLTEGTVSPAMLTFTPGNALTPRTVTVTGVNDPTMDGNVGYTIVTAAAVSTDAAYNGLNPADAGVTNNDNDTPGITVTAAPVLYTTEAGGTATFTVVLNTVPTAPVTIDLTSSDLTEGTVSPALLTFTPGNALTPQSVTVTGVGDNTLDDNVLYSVITARAGSADPSYNDLDSPDVNVLNIEFLPKGKRTYTDQDGDRYTVKLTGAGRVGVVKSDPDNDGKGPIDFILLENTDAVKSRLGVAVKKGAAGNGRVTIGGIQGTGLKGITAKAADLVGAGINLTGLLGGLSIRDIMNGADVIAGGTAAQRTTIRVHDIGAGTVLDLDNTISSLIAARFGDGAIVAPALTTLQITGDKKLGLAGDFGADVTLTGPLGTARIAGAVANASINVGGNVNSFTAGGFANSRLYAGFAPTNANNPLQGGTFTPNVSINRFTVTGGTNAFADSTVAAANIGSVNLKSVQTANGGDTFGILADTAITGVTVGTPAFQFDASQPSPQGVGDFQVKIV